MNSAGRKSIRRACISFACVVASIASSGASALELRWGAEASGGVSRAYYASGATYASDGTIVGGPAQASMTLGPVAALDSVFGGTGFTAQATASADLRTGKMRTSGSITAASQSSDSFVYSDAKIADVLTFALPTGMASALVTVSMFVDGTTYGVVQSYCIAALYSEGFPGYSQGCALSGSQTLESQVWVLPGVQYQLYAGIQQTAFNRTPAGYDFLNTATLNLTLPDGVTFESLTGYFLAGPSASVPESDTLALLGLGLVGLRLSRRRSAHRQI